MNRGERNRKKLLILEDDRLSAYMYSTYFSNFYDVKVVHNPGDFLSHFRDESVDVALIDYNIRNPEKTGIDLALEVNNWPEIDTKFVLVTAYNPIEVDIPEMFFAYHQKPVSLDRLQEQIENAILA